jgi:hypothetical protein
MLEGGLWGIFIGDALAHPIHWYYSLDLLKEHYGFVDTYITARSDVQHPDSWKYYNNLKVEFEPFDIFHDLDKYYRMPLANGYHQLLDKADNTLNIKVLQALLRSILDCKQYDQGDFLNRYISLFLEKGNHRDTYIDMSHRYFFRTLAISNNRITQTLRGDLSLSEDHISPEKVGLLEEDDCLAGLVCLLPFIVHNYSNIKENPSQFKKLLETHLWLTHPVPRLIQACLIISDLFYILVSQPSQPKMSIKNHFIESLKNLNIDNVEGFLELLSYIENSELSDEEVLMRCKMISNR